MINNKLSVTIGIPAYNEEANIAYLLRSLLKQKETNFVFKRIIVVSDGSTDNTISQVKSIRDKKIKLIVFKERQGKANAQNEIIKHTNEEVLLILDADVLPVGINFIQSMVEPILKDKNIGLVGADTISVGPRTLIEKIISDSHEFKKYMYRRINHGNNIYLCHGRARAFSKKLFFQIHWPNSYSEDAYSYLYCILNNFKFEYVPKAKVAFRSPQTLIDHINQSGRFFAGRRLMQNHFPKEFVRSQYKIPVTLLINSTWKSFLKKPVTTFIYILLTFYSSFFSSETAAYKAKWSVSPSTKRSIYE